MHRVLFCYENGCGFRVNRGWQNSGLPINLVSLVKTIIYFLFCVDGLFCHMQGKELIQWKEHLLGSDLSDKTLEGKGGKLHQFSVTGVMRI